MQPSHNEFKNASVLALSQAGHFLGRCQNDVVRWSDIPYATPPLQRLRFAPPCPMVWDADVEFDARSSDVIVAPQTPSRLANVMGDFHAIEQEDCLRLSIWSPLSAVLPRDLRPVLVWLHGGAWSTGGGALPWYDATLWAKEAGVVVVAVNYRLGALGWLLGEESDSSNLGLQDAQLAMQWVAQNIEAFGGDAQRITVMGQSAGGENIAALMQTSDELLFQQVILQSAPIGRELRTLDEAAAVRELVFEQWGVRSLEQAQSLPLDQLLKGQANAHIAAKMGALGIQGQVYTVVADGFRVPAALRKDYLAVAKKIPSIVGATREEMTAFPGMQRTQADLAIGQKNFNQGAAQWQSIAQQAEQKCWRYEFDYGPNSRFGACHCIDLPFTFGAFSAFSDAPMLDGGDLQYMRNLSQTWREALQQFVLKGDPGWVQQNLGLERIGSPCDEML